MIKAEMRYSSRSSLQSLNIFKVSIGTWSIRWGNKHEFGWMDQLGVGGIKGGNDDVEDADQGHASQGKVVDD